MECWITGILGNNLLSQSLPISHFLICLRSPYSNGHVRAGLAAERTSRALSVPLPDNIKISLPIDFFSNLDQGFWAGDRAKPTSLASFLIDFDSSHHCSFVPIVSSDCFYFLKMFNLLFCITYFFQDPDRMLSPRRGRTTNFERKLG